MDLALGPLDLVIFSAFKEKKAELKTINTVVLAEYLERIVQQAAKLIEQDTSKEFLYKNPNGWKRKHDAFVRKYHKKTNSKADDFWKSSSCNSNDSFTVCTSSSTSDDYEFQIEPWASIQDFEFPLLVHQINEFIQTWELTPATKFVVIALDKIELFRPYGERHFVEAHFSKPTPKCPNPLAVAKVYFQINVSRLLPTDYPVNVTYKFEGYESQYYAIGEQKMISNKFQRYFINSILHMKLAFYAELCECRNPLEIPREPQKEHWHID